jgi:alpha-tubulin suppressor-like RCC1 family protein
VFTGVSCWGLNNAGQLGDGTTNNGFRYGDVPNTDGTVGIALGVIHTCALRGDGAVRCWGDNSGGQLGDGTFNPRLSPSVAPSVVGINDATQIDASSGGNCVLRAAGKVSCWGLNARGEIGDGTADVRTTAVDVRGLVGAPLALFGGFEMQFAIMSDRSVNAWGDNSQGALGDGTRTTRFTPAPVLAQ